MNDNEFMLFDRITKIQSVVQQYGEENFCISFSGGKDSTVLSHLVDMAIPGNKIPRVFVDTGIEYNLIREFVKKVQSEEHPWEVVMIKPTKNIKETLETYGYPFKSKEHSEKVYTYGNQKKLTESLKRYADHERERYGCPAILRYQFTEECTLKISDKCCTYLKEYPFTKYQKEHKKPYAMVGLMREEGGRRSQSICMIFHNNDLWHFQPLVPVSSEWEQWFIEKYNIELCKLYYPPYNFTRTGCKGCPFNVDLQDALDIMQCYLPEERKQCEYIWKPVYDEYRRIGYRLKPDNVEAKKFF